ncbi:universal stress protein [Caenimonas soli]|uniref:universal stress protein n=1 Tax=Caenimonas soli TaxID=2735555 RepID=UPI001555C1CA|nr:universal stress protein [Caenimonas soli]NPC58041.1 universal stress protein [Caenimonas soli]
MKILIAVDGSELALDAVRYALQLRAEGLAAGLVLANVQEPASLYEMLTVRDPQRLQGLAASAGDHSLQGARQLCDAAGVDYELEIGLGEPAHTLLDIAERYGCSAIVAGARGKGGLGGADLGSVSHELMHVSPLPVTIVKHSDVQAGEEQPAQAEQEAPPSAETDPQPMLGLA